MNKVKRYLYELATDRRSGIVAVWLKSLLLFLSFIYTVLIRLIIAFKRRRLYVAGCKVISIGNLVLGGTGKTLLVERVSQFLAQHNHPYTIVSRGYKRPCFKKDNVFVVPYATLGDELYMLSLNLNKAVLIADSNRVRALRRAVAEYKADTVILDDGFQQWHIHKDLEIVTINANNPFGNFRMIPRGILREPIQSLARADIFVLTKIGEQSDTRPLVERLKKINPSALIVESHYQPLGLYHIADKDAMFDVSLLKGKKVALLCGIADPDSFERSLKEIGAEIALSFVFADHYCYEDKDVARVLRASGECSITTIVTTEKDSVRLAHLMPKYKDAGVSILVLKIQIAMHKNEKEFFDRLLALFSR
ncbi:MAG: tetraacyldisaccharide 4'-kinase [Candidatus Omnitrophota bacterium]|nr:MAG: tetraacyldisaccharide 4'-kinase [Candidatus Omnitrophota bacterium]